MTLVEVCVCVCVCVCQDPIHISYKSDMYSCIIMTEHGLCTLQNQVMHIVVERSSAGYPGSIMKIMWQTIEEL